MTYAVVIPSVYTPYTDSCLLSCSMDNIFVVDNTEVNMGVPKSWNIGINEMYALNADWLVICSAAIRFGPEGGLDFARWLDIYANREDAPFVEAANDIGWHLIAVSRWLIDAIGTFDENFHPAYFEDNDFAYRSFLHRGEWGWPRVSVDVALQSTAHGIKLGGVARKMRDQAEYYKRKWGDLPSHEIYKHPFDDHKLPLSYWSTL